MEDKKNKDKWKMYRRPDLLERIENKNRIRQKLSSSILLRRYFNKRRDKLEYSWKIDYKRNESVCTEDVNNYDVSTLMFGMFV